MRTRERKVADPSRGMDVNGAAKHTGQQSDNPSSELSTCIPCNVLPEIAFRARSTRLCARDPSSKNVCTRARHKGNV